MNIIESNDHVIWKSNIEFIFQMLEEKVLKNFITVEPNLSTEINDWDKTIRNESIVTSLFGDIIWDNSFINDLHLLASEFNNKFTLITDNIVLNHKLNSFDNIKILTLTEIYGIYYNPAELKDYEKLFNCFIQRTDPYRLFLFNELCKYNLLDDGYISCLGWQLPNYLLKHNISTPSEVAATLINNHSEFNYTIDPAIIPFKNFTEHENLNVLEETSKYSIVYETYNVSNEQISDFVVYTEKAIRSLQVPNISLILNSNNTSEILQQQLNLKVHPINYILDKMPDRNTQIQFIIALLQHDIITPNDDICENAIHNSNTLKNYLNIINTEQYYDAINEQII